jgi:hypothetical protein
MTETPLPEQPRLNPALRRLQRSADTVQLGVDPALAVTISGLAPAQLRCLELVDGSRALDALRADAATLGVTDGELDELLHLLHTAGALDDGAAATTLPALEPDRLALSLRYGGRTRGDAALARRREAVVDVYGAGRLGVSIATLLAAAGIGTIGCIDPHPLQPADLGAAGLAGPLGIPAGQVLAAHLRTVTPVRLATDGPSDEPTISVVAAAGPMPLPEHALAVATGPHLLVTARETAVFVGPFVVPGLTPCVRCVELSRADRDPAWPLLVAQLANRGQTAPNDVVLTQLAAAAAALDLLRYIDGGVRPATPGAVLELTADGPPRRRGPVVAHPACGCALAA